MSVVLTLLAAGLLVAAFPPFGVPFAAVLGLALLVVALRRVATSRRAAGLGALFGIVFVGALMVWIRNLNVGLADVAWVLLAAVHAPFFALFGWVTHFARSESRLAGGAITVAAWLGVFAALRWLPTFALEWADPGYTMAPFEAARDAAALFGATGWTVILAVASVGLAFTVETRDRQPAIFGLGALALVLVLGVALDPGAAGAELRVAIVQGNSPCPQVGCANERERITQQHLDLTAELEPGAHDLVVWAESSAGFATDPRLNEDVAAAIGAEARRLDAAFLIGSDRPVEDQWFVNANVFFSPAGEMLNEYRKQHPVPFGERVPWRAVFGDLPGMRVRDMLSGEGPTLFLVDDVPVGSVISFEGAFGRYARAHADLGAELLVVATNESSYGRGAAADQLIWMTRMRSAELGLDVVHAAITGASTIIVDGVPGEVSALYEPAIVTGTVRVRDAGPTPYTMFGDWLSGMMMVIGGAFLTLQMVRVAERRMR
ncbi:MAG: apolipoprotein N-acyltransferase [Acidimicrobiia bacterium]|nr:apolipoprotein N-acyltransferase [Acidimicrobiia bacterium]